jgi:hypothetical protein
VPTNSVTRPWPVLQFDEAAVREWLDDEDTRLEVLGYDADLPDYPEYGDGAAFLSHVDNLVTHAADDGLLHIRDAAGYDVVKVYFTFVSDSAGVLDGGVITVDYWRSPHGPAVRFASAPLIHNDLINDTAETGVDAAVSILRAITATVAEVLANAGAVLGLVAPVVEQAPARPGSRPAAGRPGNDVLAAEHNASLAGDDA